MPRPHPALATATASRQPRPVLTSTDLALIDAVLTHLDVPSAAIAVGLKVQEAERRLRTPLMCAALQTARHRRNGRLQIDADLVLRKWLLIESADPREISEHWLVPCRRCWGNDHHVQYDDHTWRDLVDDRQRLREQLEADGTSDAEIERKLPALELGGPGYTILREPMRGADFVDFWKKAAERQSRTVPAWVRANADHTCPACYGMGISHTVLHDTRNLSPAAAALFLGVKQTKDGTELLMRSQDDIRVMIAKHCGLLVERKVVILEDARRMSELELDQSLRDDLRTLNLVPDGKGGFMVSAPTEEGTVLP